MDFMSLALRSVGVSNGTVYCPYSFSDGFTADEVKSICVVMDRYMLTRVDSLFINWYFVKFVGLNLFAARRATWDDFDICERDLAAFIAALERYYSGD